MAKKARQEEEAQSDIFNCQSIAASDARVGAFDPASDRADTVLGIPTSSRQQLSSPYRTEIEIPDIDISIVDPESALNEFSRTAQSDEILTFEIEHKGRYVSIICETSDNLRSFYQFQMS